MAAPKIKPSAADALVGIWTVSLTAFVVVTLYFARELLIPLALSALLTFLLAPVVTRLERWVGRIAAVLLVVALIFTAVGAAGWILTRQLVDLATRLPQYKGNIVTKIRAFDTPKGGLLSTLSDTVDELKKELPGGDAQPTPTVTQQPGKPESIVVIQPSAAAPALPVEVVQSSRANPFELVQLIIAPLLGPLGMAALVLILVIFMLLEREDLRSRLIRLIGQGRISATTRAMDDAGHRVSRYLLMQLLVNLTYGVAIAVGLYFIGVPNAMLWGGFGTVLRFIPYVGPWIAAIFPTVLALAVSPHWSMPLFTIALFGVVELLLNNVMEPWLYGAHTGVSSIALIVAAVFWTWLWGPLGLVLATPLTVCLVVMGRHVPRLAFLSVVLSDEEALTPAEDCYHRFLTPGDQDELELVEAYLKSHSVTQLYDAMFIPVIINAEMDARLDLLDAEQLLEVEESMREIMEDLGSRPAGTKAALITKDVAAAAATANKNGNGMGNAEEEGDTGGMARHCRVFCLPAHAARDELAGEMLVQVLGQQGCTAQIAPARLLAGELADLAGKAEADVIFISVVTPSTVIHARYLCVKLRPLLPAQKIVVGLWGAMDDLPEATRRLRDSGADEVVTSLASAVAVVERVGAGRRGTAEVVSA